MGVLSIISRKQPVSRQIMNPLLLSKNIQDKKKNKPGKYRKIPHWDNLEFTSVSIQTVTRFIPSTTMNFVFSFFTLFKFSFRK